ncbi:hypothetical protein BCR37DRAFT_312601 [Protomyces lactucae-debilis]|uniref:Ubiquitin-like protease family profile domain-containing protein n=1 Tax=Protomyces lactucae-debilis TaxID=2754530 RepID=A0A1Y2FFS0_PROLT|nr:uncharacterized protein BCR37DRAFT_312601 [Protomyces lactucae-debilis]ORY82457.1 hypothetical protein BCR37DRAFT_312601 [Protomyces lactucae-debilis]
MVASARSPSPAGEESNPDEREGRRRHHRLSFRKARDGMKRVFRGSRSQTRPVLEYFDVCLRQEDIDNYKDENWLQDSNIEFFYEWMEREKMPKSDPQLVFLVRPSIGYLVASIAQQGGVVDASLLPDGFLDARYVFLPITDNIDPSKAGGSHWSLLVVGVDEKLAWYYDSLPTSGSDKMTDARHYLLAMSQVYGTTFEAVVQKAPKQANGSDCGIHVCMTTDVLLSRMQLLTSDSHRDMDLSVYGIQQDAKAYRESLLKLISSMLEMRGPRIGSRLDVAISPERRSQSRTRPSLDQRLMDGGSRVHTIVEEQATHL